MKFFIDTANVAEIRKANDMGVIAGVTTNPSLIAKEGRDYAETLAATRTAVIRLRELAAAAKETARETAANAAEKIKKV